MPSASERTFETSKLFVLGLAALVLSLGCWSERAPGDRAFDEGAFESPASDSSTAGQSEALDEISTAARKLIRNAYITLEVTSTAEATAKFRALVKAVGGYVGNESQSEDGYGAQYASLTCRVPAATLDKLLTQVQGQGTVEALQISAEDITEQYFDLEIRLGTQTQLESRLLELLDRSSNELKDLLEIERELARVRGQIDQMEGRRRFWDHQVAMATLQIELHEPRPAVSGREGGVFRTLRQALRDAGDNFVDALAFVISSIGALIPIVTALVAVIWILLRLRRRKRE